MGKVCLELCSGKSEKEHAKELASKARTLIGKLQKLAQDSDVESLRTFL